MNPAVKKLIDQFNNPELMLGPFLESHQELVGPAAFICGMLQQLHPGAQQLLLAIISGQLMAEVHHGGVSQAEQAYGELITKEDRVALHLATLEMAYRSTEAEL